MTGCQFHGTYWISLNLQIYRLTCMAAWPNRRKLLIAWTNNMITAVYDVLK